MIEISYITESLVKMVTEEPHRLISVLEYACAFTLLIAMASDSIIRRRRPARQKSTFRDRIGRK
jgi:hypothetical protein